MDLGSPYAYLAAARIDDVVGDADWQVVLLGAIFKATGRASWGESPARAAGRAEVERRARQRGLPPIRWPEPWPADGLLAARVATWADLQGDGRAFIEASLAIQFADGRSIADPAVVTEAVERAGLDPSTAIAAAGDPAIKRELRDRTDAALAAGVFGVPSVIVGPFVCWGDDQLEQAAILASSRTTANPDPANPHPAGGAAHPRPAAEPTDLTRA